jgi:hypothetical protein
MKRPLLYLIAVSAFGQQQPPPLVPSLIEYLDLTGTQITRLRQHASEFNAFYAANAARHAQISQELFEET